MIDKEITITCGTVESCKHWGNDSIPLAGFTKELNTHKDVIAKLTILTAHQPSVLSKRVSVADNGSINKIASASLTEGVAEIVSIGGCGDLASLLWGLSKNQAFMFGMPKFDNIQIVTRHKWKQLGCPDDPQPRTQEAFEWPAGPGVMLIDYDPSSDSVSLTKEELIGNIRLAVPGLQAAQMVWWASSSSFIYSGDIQIIGLKGQRLYILVQDASDIPRAGKALVDHLWAAGHGYIKISRSGAMLERCLVDGSVWQTNRLDFAAGAYCEPPLEQRRGVPEIVLGESEFIDTKVAIPDLTPEQTAHVEGLKKRARLEKSAEAERAKTAWVEERVAAITESSESGEEVDQSNIQAIVRRAVENKVLCGEYDFFVIDEGQRKRVTVNEVLDDPHHYHHMSTLDPIEPEYDSFKVVGKLYLLGATQNLHSFAHGGQNYKLIRDTVQIELVNGRTHDAVENALAVMRTAPDVFDFGSALSLAEGGHLHPMDEHHLAHWLGGVVQFWGLARGNNLSPILKDPPPAVCRRILSLKELRRLKPLKAVITAPILRVDGSTLSTPGYDEATGLLLDCDDFTDLPKSWTDADLKDALGKLMYPFKDFPLASDLDRGILLSALLTAAIRPTLPTCPDFGIDAPVQASGKTLLANCVAALATGDKPTIWPHTVERGNDETRKRLFSALRSGERCIVWDNVVGTYDSAAMAAAITASTFQDRVLGKSETQTVPNKAIIIFTGNNLTLAGDLPRRVLICRIDPNTERPFARKFDIDPLAYVLANRQSMVRAALILIRGWLHSFEKDLGLTAKGRMASFEIWDDLVRQTVCWVGTTVSPRGYDDPMKAIDEAQQNDPEQEALLSLLKSLHVIFGHKAVTASEILKQARSFSPLSDVHDHTGELRESMEELFGEVPKSAKSLGRSLRYRKDRIVGGLRLEVGPPDRGAGSSRWKVVQVDQGRV